MNDPFENLPSGRIPLQKREGGEIKKKKAGRPRLPHMITAKYRIDQVLNLRFLKCVQENHTQKSVVLSQLIKEYLERNRK